MKTKVEDGRISTKNGRIDFFEEGNNVIVEDFYVSEKARNKGVGSGLLKKVEEFAFSKNKDVQLTPIATEPSMATETLIVFYKKRGYVKNGSGESGEGMIKNLTASGVAYKTP